MAGVVKISSPSTFLNGIALITKGGSTYNAPGTVIQNPSDYFISPLQIMIDLPMDKKGNELAENGVRDYIITVLTLESPRGKTAYLQPRSL